METNIAKGSDIIHPDYGRCFHLIINGHTLYTANTHFMHVNDIEWLSLIPSLHTSFQKFPDYNQYVEQYCSYIDIYLEEHSNITEHELQQCFEAFYRDYEKFIQTSQHREFLRNVDIYNVYFDPETEQLTYTVMPCEQ